jgi:hypothetical protein
MSTLQHLKGGLSRAWETVSDSRRIEVTRA